MSDTPDIPETNDTPDAPVDDGVLPPADSAVTDPAEATDAGDPDRSRIVIGIAVVLLLGTLGWFLLRNPEEVATPTTTTTSTTSETTTTGPSAWPAITAKVATVNNGLTSIAVLSTPPPEWDDATPVLAWDAPQLPASQDVLPERPELPRPDYPITGRTSTDTGWAFSNPSPFDEAMTFLVTEVRGEWAQVMIPVRPNHTEGWVRMSEVTVEDHDYRVELRLGEHRLTVYKGTEIVLDTPVVIGKEATRTPAGRFYVTDKVEQTNPAGFYGPYILPLNAYSEQLDIFDDGVPVVALHGTSRPELVGQSVSNGCVRMDNEVITQLYNELPLGTPVEIYA